MANDEQIPPRAAERIGKYRECLDCPEQKEGEKPCAVLGRNRVFRFDEVFTPQTTQERVYSQCISSLVHSCFAGYNATVLAYGQTGSGKTYTMGSADTSEFVDDSDFGVLPRVMSDLFQGVEQRRKSADVHVKCAFLEIHNEEVKDLLHPETPSKSISIRERGDGAIVVSGIKEVATTNYEEMMAALEKGCLSRTTGQTQMNERSSRSHAIFTIMLQMRSGRSSKNGSKYITSKFHLVDLAGSERNKKTLTSGARFKESVTINQGLLALGNVINALTDERRKPQHIPYRQSKLTRLLQDSLGGNSRTVMIACVPTADLHFEETLNTLKYASRARHIRNKPVVNTEPEAANLAAGREDVPQEAEEPIDWENERERLKQAHDEMHKALTSANEELQDMKSKKQSAEDELVTLKAERDHAKLRLQEINESFGSVKSTLNMLAEEGSISRNLVEYVLHNSLDDTKTQEVESLEVAAKEDDNDEVLQLKRQLAMKAEKVDELKKKIQQDQDDLQKDEQIFAEKNQELDRLRSRTSELENEKNRMKEQLQMERNNDHEGHHEFDSSIDGERRRSDGMRFSRGAAYAESIEGEDAVLVDLAQAEDEQEADRGGGGEQAVSDLRKSVHDVKQLKEKVHHEETEKERLLRDKEQIEEEKQRLQNEAEQKDKEYKRSKKQLESQLKELEQNIKEQEDLIKEKERNEEELKELSAQYEQRMMELQEQVGKKEEEVENLQQQLKEVEESAQQSAEHKRQLRDHYETKLSEVKSELTQLKNRANAERNAKDQNLRLKSESKVSELQQDLKRMKQQQDSLRQKLREQTEKQAEARQKLQEELSQKKAQAEKGQKRIRELEDENRRQRRTLEQKEEEMAAAHRRLKQLGLASAAQAGKPSSSGRDNQGPQGGRSGKKPSSRPSTGQRRPSTAHAARKQEDQGFDIDKQCAWIDQNLNTLLKEKEANSELEEAKARQTSLQADKESQLEEKSKLELKRRRMQAAYEKTKEQANKELVTIDEQLSSAEQSAAAGDAKAEKQAAQLRKKKQDIEARKDEAEQNLKENALLSQEDETALQNVEENLDGLEAELEYVSGEVAERQREAQENSIAASAFKEQVKQLSGEAAKAALAGYVDKAAWLGYREGQEQARVCELEVQLKEQSKRTEELENTLKRKELEYDRRVVDLRKESERRVQMMLKRARQSEEQTSQKGEPSLPKRQGEGHEEEGDKDKEIESLTRHTQYYKQANRELQRKVHELSQELERARGGESSRPKQGEEGTSPQRSPSKRPQSSPTKLKSSPKEKGGQSALVRVSKEHVKPVDDEQVAQRASAAGLEIPEQSSPRRSAR